MKDFDLLPFRADREIVVDAGFLGSRRHIIFGLIEVDVTDALEIRRVMALKYNSKPSFTAFIVASYSRAIASHPEVQAYRDWRRRLVVFRDVDVVTMIEPEPGLVAIPHIIRNANRKSLPEINDEIRSIQANPEKSEQRGKLISLAPRFPRFTRLFFFWLIKRNPHWFKRFEGTTVVTSVGMFGAGGGWGIGFLPSHTLGLTVGGIVQKPGVHHGEIKVRDYLNLTIAFDHDIVDGAPAARFTSRLIENLKKATVLEEVIN